MNTYETLKHTTWECKCHVVFVRRCRKKVLYRELRRELAGQKESQVVDGHLMADHVHMLLSLPPKYAVSQLIGFLKGKAPYVSPGCMRGGGVISQDIIFGREGAAFPRWGRIKSLCAAISKTRKRKINGWINLS